MEKKVLIPAVGVSVFVGLLSGICVGRSVNPANGQVLRGYQSYSVAKVNTEMAEYVKTEYENAKGRKEYWENSHYEIFYGEWEATDVVYVDQLPLYGAQGGGVLTEEEQEEVKVEFAQRTKEEGIRKIKFAQHQIIVNDKIIFEDVRYDMRIFPSMDDYRIHFTMTLEDIGLTEESGSYYAYIEADGNVMNPDEEWHSGRSTVGSFFVKDENTLLFSHYAWYIEYKRVSFEGGAETPSIILG